MRRTFRSIALAVAVLGASSVDGAVSYVEVCSLYGAGFHSIPGRTDVCMNPTTGEVKQDTVGGLWPSGLPNRKGAWVMTPKLDCPLGLLVNVGSFTAANFSLNSHWKYETPLIPLTLKSNEFVGKVMMSGGFDVTGGALVCLSFYDAGSQGYSTLGCLNTALLKTQPGAYSFSPFRSVPPSSFGTPFNLVVHSGYDSWEAPVPPPPPPPPPSTLTFNGTVNCWICIQPTALQP